MNPSHAEQKTTFSFSEQLNAGKWLTLLKKIEDCPTKMWLEIVCPQKR